MCIATHVDHTLIPSYISFDIYLYIYVYIYTYIFFFFRLAKDHNIILIYISFDIYFFRLSPREGPPPPADERVYARYNPQALQPNQASDCSPAYREQELKHPRPWRTTTQGFLLVCFAPRRPSVCLRPQPQTPEEATPPSEFSSVRVFLFHHLSGGYHHHLSGYYRPSIALILLYVLFFGGAQATRHPSRIFFSLKLFSRCVTIRPGTEVDRLRNTLPFFFLFYVSTSTRLAQSVLRFWFDSSFYRTCDRRLAYAARRILQAKG